MGGWRIEEEEEDEEEEREIFLFLGEGLHIFGNRIFLCKMEYVINLRVNLCIVRHCFLTHVLLLVPNL